MAFPSSSSSACFRIRKCTATKSSSPFATRTAEVVAVGEGVVYPVLHALESDGALRSRRKTVNGRSRIYYSLTPAGTRRLAALSHTWSHLAAAVQTVLTGGQHAKPIQ